MEKIYYISQFDNEVHNINDVEHMKTKKDADIHIGIIGKDCGDDGFRVDEEVVLYDIIEVGKFFEDNFIEDDLIEDEDSNEIICEDCGTDINVDFYNEVFGGELCKECYRLRQEILFEEE